MRTRRAFVTGSAVTAATVVAGCVEDGEGSGDGNATGRDGARANGTADEGDTEDGAVEDGDGSDGGDAARSITVESVTAPERAAIGEDFAVEIRLGNDGPRGSYPLELERRTDGQWERIVARNVTVDAGGNTTVTVPGINGTAVGTHRFRVGQDGPTAETRVVGAQRTVGDGFATRGIEVTVDEIRYRRSYTYLDEDETKRVEAPRRRQFAWVWVTAENAGETRTTLPKPNQFVLRIDGTEYGPVDVDREEDRFRSATVLPGSNRNGWIAFEVPMDLEKSDVEVAWFETGDDGEVQAFWRPE
jgi:hypothetical protein